MLCLFARTTQLLCRIPHIGGFLHFETYHFSVRGTPHPPLIDHACDRFERLRASSHAAKVCQVEPQAFGENVSKTLLAAYDL